MKKKIVDIAHYKKWFFDNWGQLGSVQDSIVKYLEEQPDYEPHTEPATPKDNPNMGHWFKMFREQYEQFAQAQRIKVKWSRAENMNLDNIITVLLHKTDNDYQRAFDGWVFILNNWNNLTPFLRDQLLLPAINKNLEEIIRKLSRHVQESTNKGLGKWA